MAENPQLYYDNCFGLAHSFAVQGTTQLHLLLQQIPLEPALIVDAQKLLNDVRSELNSGSVKHIPRKAEERMTAIFKILDGIIFPRVSAGSLPQMYSAMYLEVRCVLPAVMQAALKMLNVLSTEIKNAK